MGERETSTAGSIACGLACLGSGVVGRSACCGGGVGRVVAIGVWVSLLGEMFRFFSRIIVVVSGCSARVVIAAPDA